MLGVRKFRKECGSSLQCGERFLMRIDTPSKLTGAQVIRNGSRWQTGLLIVGGDLRANHILLVSNDVFECLCDAPVEETPMRSAQGGVGFLAELLMAKVIGIG